MMDVGDLTHYNELVNNGEINRRGIVFTFGGILGEIILVFSAIVDYLQTVPGQTGFKFTSEQFE